MEASKLINYINNKINQIKQDYYNFNKTLIISNNYTDVAIILFIFMLEELCNMNYKQSLLSIQSKMHSKLIIQNQNTKLLLQKNKKKRYCVSVLGFAPKDSERFYSQ